MINKKLNEINTNDVKKLFEEGVKLYILFIIIISSTLIITIGLFFLILFFNVDFSSFIQFNSYK